MRQEGDIHIDTIRIRMRLVGRAVFQAEANNGGGAYSVGPDFVSFVSLATSLAHVDGMRFGIVAGGRGGEGGELVCP